MEVEILFKLFTSFTASVPKTEMLTKMPVKMPTDSKVTVIAGVVLAAIVDCLVVIYSSFHVFRPQL